MIHESQKRAAEVVRAVSGNGSDPKTTPEGQRSGLSSTDLEEIDREHRLLVADLASTLRGREALRSASTSVDMMAGALLAEIDDLGAAMNGDDADRIPATIALSDIQTKCNHLVGPAHYAARTRAFRFCQSLHMSLDRRMRRTAPRASPKWAEHGPKIWGWSGSFLSFVAAGFVIAEAYLIIAVLALAMRIAVTTVVWWKVAYPGDDSPDKPVLDQEPRICVLGHAADLAMLTAIGVFLMHNAHWTAGVAIFVASHVLMLGSLFRLVARAPRLHVERMARGAAILGAVVAIMAGSPVVAAGCVFLPLVVAAVEVKEAWRVLRPTGDADRSYGDVQTHGGSVAVQPVPQKLLQAPSALLT